MQYAIVFANSCIDTYQKQSIAAVANVICSRSIRRSNLIQLAITPSAAIYRINAIHSTHPSCEPDSSVRCLHLIVLVDVESVECSCCQRMISHSNSMYWLLPGMLTSYAIRMITKHGHIHKSWMPHPMLLLSLLNNLARRSIWNILAPIMHLPTHEEAFYFLSNFVLIATLFSKNGSPCCLMLEPLQS